MQKDNQKPRQTIHQATYHLVRQLAQQMKPVAQLAQEASDPNEPDPTDIIIELLRQLGNGIEQVQSRLETMEARLDDPAVEKAIKSIVHG